MKILSQHLKQYTFLSALLMIAMTSSAQIMWENQQDVASAATGNHRPQIAVDRSGNPLIIWENASKVMFTRWNGTGFDQPRSINPSNMTIAGASWMGPDIASHGDTVYVVFKQTPEHTGKSWIIHSYDRGETFSTPVSLDFSTDSISRFPAVTVDNIGNPIVGYMKFDHDFGDARWVVTRSNDFGNTFSPDVLASRFSSPDAFVCDCCPGEIISSDETVAMLYRDNNDNIRDSWAGISHNSGMTFSEGMNIDQHEWNINFCPSTGPDGVIIGDSLYAVFMNGASGMNRVYFSSSSVETLETTGGVLLTGDIDGLTQQNFPRIASYNEAVGVIWKQVVDGQDQLVMQFTSDISQGLPSPYDTVDLARINNADIAMWDGRVYVVWEDNNTGTVKIRSGDYEVRTGIENDLHYELLEVYPNPSSDMWVLKGEILKVNSSVEIYDVNGRLVDVFLNDGVDGQIEISNSKFQSGSYVVRVRGGERVGVKSLLKQ